MAFLVDKIFLNPLVFQAYDQNEVEAMLHYIKRKNVRQKESGIKNKQKDKAKLIAKNGGYT